MRSRRWCQVLRGGWLAGLALIAAMGCHSPGPYGYSRAYSALDEEEDALVSAQEYDPVMASRRPEAWQQKPVALFGVVEGVHAQGTELAVKLSLRHLEPRNLCSSTDQDTCRVTVSDREHGKLRAVVRNDPAAERPIRAGSLLRLVGSLEAPDEDGLPVVRASYARHWPAGFYVTSAARQFMLR